MTSTDQLITGVDFVCVPTNDFAASVSFYGETLGLPAGNPLDLHHRYAPPKPGGAARA